MLTVFDPEPVDVVTIYKSTKEKIRIFKIRWQNKEYSITQLGYHHKYKIGFTLIHVFHVTNDSLAFRLEFYTDTLEWKLTEVSDGQPN